MTDRDEILECLYMFFEAAGMEDDRIAAELDDASLETLINLYNEYCCETDDLDW